MSNFIAGVFWYLFALIGWLCKVFKHPFRTQWEERSVGLYYHCVVCGALMKQEKNSV